MATYYYGTTSAAVTADIAGKVNVSHTGTGVLTDRADGDMSGSVWFGWGKATWRFVWAQDFRPSSVPTYTLTLTIQDWLSGTTYTSSSTTTVSGSLPGTFSGSISSDAVDCWRCVSITNPLTGSGHLAQFWGRIPDSPPNTDYALQLIPKANQTIFITLVVAGVTLVHKAGTGSSPAALGYTYRATGTLDLSIGGTGSVDATIEGETHATVTSHSPFTLSGVGGLSKTSTAGNSTSTATVAQGEARAYGICSMGASSSSGFAPNAAARATADRTEKGDRSVSWSAVLRRMGIANAASLDILTTGLDAGATYTITGATGSAARSFTQQYCSQSVDTFAEEDFANDTDTASNTTDTYRPVTASITAASLTAAGDDPDAMRLAMRGWYWSAASFSQSATKRLDEGDALTITTGDYPGAWSEAGAGSAALSGGYVQWSGGASSTLSRSFDAGYGFLAAYRFLRLRVRCSVASQALTVAIGTKTWSVTTDPSAGTWATLWIDLDLPTNLSTTTDATDTRYPEDSSGYPSEGDYFGVGRAASIELTGLTSGTLDIDWIELAQYEQIDGAYASSTRLDFLQTLGWWQQRIPDATVGSVLSEYKTNRFLSSKLDEGGQGVEEGALWRQDDTGGAGTNTTWTHRTILDGVSRVGHRRYPGWSSASLQAVPSSGCELTLSYYSKFLLDDWMSPFIERFLTGDTIPPLYYCYANDANYLAFLWGAGALRQPSGWSYGLDQEATGGINVIAQTLFDSLSDWWPGCVDEMGLRNTGDPNDKLYLFAATTLGGAAWGIVGDSSHAPLAGETVDLVQSAANRGSSTTDAIGGYETGSPYGFGAHAASIEHGSDSISLATLFTRKWHRGVFLFVPDNFEGIANIGHESGFYCTAWPESGLIKFRRSEYAIPTSWLSTVNATAPGTGETDTEPRLDYDKRRALILMFTRKGGGAPGAYVAYSFDAGATWETPTLAFAGCTHPDTTEDLFGNRLWAAYLPDTGGVGTIQGTWQSAGDSAMGTAFTFQKSTGGDLRVQNDRFKLARAYEGGARLLLIALVEGDTAPSNWWSADRGATWTLIP